jgi:hypothetical protein
MNTLVTLPIKTTQYSCIVEDKEGVQFIYICNKKLLVQRTSSDPKKPTKFIATVNFSNIRDFIAYAEKLNSKGIEYYKAHY